MLFRSTKKGGPTFTADPENITMEKRYDVYKNMTRAKFNKKWKGKKVEVTYHKLSDDGIPLQPKVTINNLI